MAEFPATPISPSEFMETFVPSAMAAAAVGAAAGDADVKLGVLLSGDGGGEWVVHLSGGSVTVVAGPRAEAAFTIVQTVDDWRGALWEGRGGVFGEQATALFRGDALGGAAASAPRRCPSAAALGQLAALNGLIRITVKGGTGGDWSTGFKLGAGDIPAEPTTEVSITAEDAQAMQEGTLDPMQAFMSGKIMIAGDMTLMMQMQAIAMQAAAGG